MKKIVKRSLLALAISSAAAGSLVTSSAFAEDYTTSTIAGQVRDSAGNMIPGAIIEITSDKGIKRSATVDADGSFRMQQLPIGSYKARVSADGYNGVEDVELNLTIGAGGKYTFTLKPLSGDIEEVYVVGAKQAEYDFNSTTSGISVDVGELQSKYPVARSLTDVALFAPGTQEGDTAFNSRSNGSLASFSGGSVGENAYYINGLNVTNFRNFTGGSTIPFEFYDQIEVKTGGYQAEYGRSIGGFINSVSKSGSNDFHASVTAYYEPDSLRSTAKDIETTWNSLDTTDSTDYIIELSGAVIEDRLFAYGLYNIRENEEEDYTSGRYTQTRDNDPFWAVKLDFIPFDGHRIEYTGFSDRRDIEFSDYNFNDAGADREDVNGSEIGSYIGDSVTEAGGTNQIVKYTGVFSDAFSLSMMYGENEFFRSAQSANDVNPVIYQRIDNPNSSVAIGNWTNTYAATGYDKREAFRIDADIYFEFAGEHHIRFGYDQENLLAEELSTLSGGEYWRYHTCTSAAGCFSGQLAQGEEYVRHLVIDQGGNFEVEQSAYYIQDSWQVTSQLTVNLGLRNETFNNMNAEGETFIKADNQIAPRLGLTYDLFGDGDSRITAFFGRYYMPIAANTNIRMSGAEYFVEEYLRHDGYDNRNSDDTPSGVDYNDPLLYTLSSDGTVPDVSTIKDQSVDPLYTDEISLSYEHVFENEWVAGIRGTYRKLAVQIDDVGINHATVAWALENGYDLDDVYWIMDPSQHGIDYVLTNPGTDMRVATDLLTDDGSLVWMDLTKEMLGYEEPDRVYRSLELSLSKGTEIWGIDGSYVYTSNKGNTEGVVKSDNGQDDAGLTQDFDLVSVMMNAYGPLPTEFEHQFKLAGFYKVNDWMQVGARARIRSPRKFGCQGNLPNGTFGDSDNAFDGNGDFTGDLAALRQVYESRYQDDYWFCNGEASPRGKSMESNWVSTVDASATFTPNLGGSIPGGITIRLDVFNLFDSSAKSDLFEQLEDSSGGQYDNYGQASAYQSPRSMRLSFNWTL
ncbi:TonB-dependent receptor [Simiduia curdlanivorans]|uniref:TonB-dependent receptor domain-containing protein n=1 Tax=Simiduia curdlanivorans TaxID=1492769 RepID=A0ABV8V6P2_9GAMM|nr:TonB-dependent receptor [Simiduia curdlanivorans]MDN3638890.1 TonB-dependent receptor [Simiduia curdlanivorans]